MVEPSRDLKGAATWAEGSRSSRSVMVVAGVGGVIVVTLLSAIDCVFL